jgi:hypothetical protein
VSCASRVSLGCAHPKLARRHPKHSLADLELKMDPSPRGSKVVERIYYLLTRLLLRSFGHEVEERSKTAPKHPEKRLQSASRFGRRFHQHPHLVIIRMLVNSSFGLTTTLSGKASCLTLSSLSARIQPSNINPISPPRLLADPVWSGLNPDPGKTLAADSFTIGGWLAPWWL